MSVGCKAKAIFNDPLVRFNSIQCTFNGDVNRVGGLIGNSGFDYKPQDFSGFDYKPQDNPNSSDDNC
jgi:hypothetical protein